MSKSVFISYVYEDKKYRDTLKKWGNKNLLGENIQITFERGDYRAKGEKAVKEEILSMIQGATAVIFLIGQNTHNHPWVNYEVECAKAKNKKILLVRIPNTTGGKPKLLSKHNEIDMDANKLKLSFK
jgi:hypothetical protein